MTVLIELLFVLIIGNATLPCGLGDRLAQAIVFYPIAHLSSVLTRRLQVLDVLSQLALVGPSPVEDGIEMLCALS